MKAAAEAMDHQTEKLTALASRRCSLLASRAKDSRRRASSECKLLASNFGVPASQSVGRTTVESPARLGSYRMGGAEIQPCRSSTFRSHSRLSRSILRPTMQLSLHSRAVLPNLSFKRRANGLPPGPPAGLAHFPSVGPGVLPLLPA